MGASPAVLCSAWLAEHKVSYSRIWLWLHRDAFVYCTTELPAGNRRTDPTIASSGAKAPPWLHQLPTPRTVRRPGSLAAAKRRPSCIVSDWIRGKLQRVAKQFAG